MPYALRLADKEKMCVPCDFRERTFCYGWLDCSCICPSAHW